MKRRRFSLFALAVVAAVLVFYSNHFASAQMEWTQMNMGGFGQPNQYAAFSMAEYQGYYYVGTADRDDTGCQVWRYDGPHTHNWTKVNSNGFGHGLDIVTDLVVYDGMLYASTIQYDGSAAEVWAYNGSSWTQAGESGLGDLTIEFVWDLLVFDGKLWAGTHGSDGAGVFAWEGSSWTRMNTGGSGNGNNEGPRAMAIFNGSLYTGSYNGVHGCEVYRFDGPGPSDWVMVLSGGFGNPSNIDVRSMATFGDRLILGTANTADGLEIYAYDGDGVERIDPENMQFESARSMAIASDSMLYVGTGNNRGYPSGAQIWRYDGTDWTMVNTRGFGDDNNLAAHSILAADSMLLVGTANDVTGGQVWSAPIQGGAGPFMYRLHVPAAAFASGAADSFFQTDADLNNTAPDMDVQYEFWWLPRETDNVDPMRSEIFSLAPGHSVRVENILSTIFDLEPDEVGAVVIAASNPNLRGMTRTYNLSTAKVAGTFGQALPAVPEDELIQTGQTRRIIFMSENADIRANLGCINGTDSAIAVLIDLYDASGTSLETKTMNLGPWSNDQLNRIFRSYSPVNGYVDVRSNTTGALFYCYGSLLDNDTSDPTTILPQS